MSIAEDDSSKFRCEDLGDVYQCYSSRGAIGKLVPWWHKSVNAFTQKETWRAVCSKHGVKCNRLLEEKGRKPIELMRITGEWLIKNADMNVTEHMACRPS